MDDRPSPSVFKALWTFRWSSLLIVALIVVLSGGYGYVTKGATSATARMVLATPNADDVVGVSAPTEPTFVRYIAQRALFVTSERVLSAAADDLGDTTVEALRENVTATAKSDGSAILVTSTAPTPGRAAKISNSVVASYRQQSEQQVTSLADLALEAVRRSEARIVARIGLKQAESDVGYQTLSNKASSIAIATAKFGSGVTFVDPASAASAEAPGLPYLDVAVGLAFGLLVAAVIAWLRADNVGTHDPITTSTLDIPMFGKIGRFSPLDNGGKLDRSTLPNRHIQKAWVIFEDKVSGGALVVAGATPAAGSTTVAIQLAASAACDGYRVLLVDTARDIPRMSDILHFPANRPGFDAVVAGAAELNECVRQTKVGPSATMWVLLAGTPEPLPAGRLRSEAIGDALSAMRESFDLVIVDISGEIDTPTNAAVLKRSDHVLLVARSGTDSDELRGVVDRLAVLEAKPMGYVVNNPGARHDAPVKSA